MHEDESYVVILRKGNGYLLPWTAYVIEHNWRRKKFIKEYEEYIKKQGDGNDRSRFLLSTPGW